MTRTINTSMSVQGGYELMIPTLTGSTKQVNFAREIRIKFLTVLQNYDDKKTLIGKEWETGYFGMAIQKFLDTYKTGKYWIENMGDITDEKAINKVLIFYTENTVQNENPKNKGLLTTLTNVIHKTSGTCEISGINKNGKQITSLRKEWKYDHKPGKVLVNFDTDIYEFEYQNNIAVNITFVENFKKEVVKETEPIEIIDPVETFLNPEEIPVIETIEESTSEPEIVIDYNKGEIFHESHNKILACVNNDIPVYLVGPAGSGKNHTLEQVARELNLKFYFTNSIQQEHKLTGFIDAGGRYHETEFYKAFTNGGLFFLDEMDASIPEVLVLLNAAIANGYFEFPNGRVEAHIDFRVVAAGNTMGSGADDLYTGRLVLDQATLDRFCIIEFDYDLRIEMKLAKGNMDLVNFVRDLRKQSEQLGIRATFSYRCIMSATKLDGVLTVQEIIKIAIVKGLQLDVIKTYNPDESNKYGRELRKIQRSA